MTTVVPPEEGLDASATEVVALLGENGDGWATAYWDLVQRGATPLLLDVSSPEGERQRMMDLVGATRVLRAGVDRLDGASAESVSETGEVLIGTSGSTGRPKLVRRSIASLDAEGARKAAWCDLGPADHVVIASPLWHAYALGWLHAARVAGARVSAVPPTGRGLVERALADGATVLAVVPSVVRILTARRRVLQAPQLRLVMCGAGHLDADASALLSRSCGVAPSRDYGSTETGSLFSARPEDSPDRVGHPLDGVEHRLTPGAGGGRLEVRVSGIDEEWHSTGDLAEYDATLGLRLIGREGRAIRTSDRWVAPGEIEQAFEQHPDVLAARAFPVQIRKDTLVGADILTCGGSTADTADVIEFVRSRISNYKVPTRVSALNRIDRGGAGKTSAPSSVVLADAVVLREAAWAYRRSELLFALRDLGILDLLIAEPLDASDLADRLGLDRLVVDNLVRVATDTGLLVEHSGEPDRNDRIARALDVVDLEAELSRGLVTRKTLQSIARTGLANRDLQRPSERLARTYLNVMHGTESQRRGALVRSLLQRQPGQVLEITAGPACVADEEQGDLALTIGAISGGPGLTEVLTRLEQSPNGYDAVVLRNVIHHGDADIRRLSGLVVPGGRLIVDDFFLSSDDQSALAPEAVLDWLTHGGVSWPELALLQEALTRCGLEVDRVLSVGSPAATVLVARKAAETEHL